jgi:hypothetical protein
MQKIILGLSLLAAQVLAGPVIGVPQSDKLDARSPAPDPVISALKARQTSVSVCPDPLNTPADTDDWNCDAPCPGVSSEDNSFTCVGYCQARSSWFPGPEEPFQNSACTSGDACTLATGKTTTITNTYTINVGGSGTEVGAGALTSAFNFGASYSWSKAVGYTTTQTHTRDADQTATTCGYFTFVPYYMS